MKFCKCIYPEKECGKQRKSIGNVVICALVLQFKIDNKDKTKKCTNCLLDKLNFFNIKTQIEELTDKVEIAYGMMKSIDPNEIKLSMKGLEKSVVSLKESVNTVNGLVETMGDTLKKNGFE